jgi:hypothetical protein
LFPLEIVFKVARLLFNLEPEKAKNKLVYIFFSPRCKFSKEK